MTKRKLPSKMLSHNEDITNRLNSHELVRIIQFRIVFCKITLVHFKEYKNIL